MSALLPIIFDNKYLLASAAALISGLVLFFKGYFQGRAAVNLSDEKAEISLNQDVQKTEAQNQSIETKRSEDETTAITTNDIDGLIKLWDGIQKASSDKTKPN